MLQNLTDIQFSMIVINENLENNIVTYILCTLEKEFCEIQTLNQLSKYYRLLKVIS